MDLTWEVRTSPRNGKGGKSQVDNSKRVALRLVRTCCIFLFAFGLHWFVLYSVPVPWEWEKYVRNQHGLYELRKNDSCGDLGAWSELLSSSSSYAAASPR